MYLNGLASLFPTSTRPDPPYIVAVAARVAVSSARHTLCGERTVNVATALTITKEPHRPRVAIALKMSRARWVTIPLTGNYVPTIANLVRSPSKSEKPVVVSDTARGSWQRASWKHSFWLRCCMASLLLAGCKRFSVVNPDDAIPAGQKFWQLLQTSDVPNAVEMYDPSVWSADSDLRDRWSRLLDGLGNKFGPVSSVELGGRKWFPGSTLVSDHRASFTCYAYDYDVKRQTLASHERLIICGDSGAAGGMRIYAHEMKRQDTQQVIRVGINWVEKSLQ